MTHNKASLELSKDVKEFVETNHVVCDAPEQEIKIEQNHYGPRIELFRDDVPRDRINVCGQMRDSASFDDGGELVHSIRKKGLYNPFIVYELSPDDAMTYVDITNDGFDADIDFEDFTPNENGNYYVLVAGERRFRSVKRIEELKGVENSNPTLTCQIRRCDNLSDLLDAQYSENVYNPPAAHKYAAIIHERFLLGMKIGEYETVEDFIKDSPASRRTTKNAMRFFNLPDSIREFVAKGTIPYYHALDLEVYSTAKRAHLEGIDEDIDVEDVLFKDLFIKIQQHLKDGCNRSLLKKRVAGWVAAIGDYQLDLADLMLERQLTETEIVHKQLAAQRREFVNGANNSLRGLNRALDIIAEYDPRTMDDISANVAKLIEQNRELLSHFVELHGESSRGDLAKAVVELSAELDLFAC